MELTVRAAVIFSLLGFTARPVSAQESQSVLSVDCRIDRPAAGGAPQSVSRDAFLPESDLFAPPLADQKEPRFSFSAQHVRFAEGALPSDPTRATIAAGHVSAGGIYGLWARRDHPGCDGLQVGLTGGVFSQFNLSAPSQDLINTDFIVGVQVTMRHAGMSGRIRLYHQSSHLGDEFLLHNPTVLRRDFGFQAIDALGSFDRSWWRVYAGGGYVFFSESGLDPGMLQAGGEARGMPGVVSARPILAFDVTALQARDWKATTSVAGGLEWGGAVRARRLRALVVFIDGYSPFGQFSTEQTVRNLGIQLQLDF